MSNPSPRSSSSRNATLVANAALVPCGIANVLLGPLLPTLAANWTINDTQSGDLFFVQFCSSTVGVLLSGVLVPRWGYRFTILLGLIFTALGVGALAFLAWPAGLLAGASWGFGFGITIPACNLLVAATTPIERRAAALNLLNFFWSVGAVSCPFLLAPFERSHQVERFLLLLGGFILILTLGLSLVPFPNPAGTTAPSRSNSGLKPLLFSRLALVFAALFFCYTGVENAVGGWVASYAQRMSSTSPLWVMMPSFFYMALTAGRASAPVVLRRMRDIPLARCGLTLAALGIFSLLFSSSLLEIFASICAVGLGLAAVYPITISHMSQTAGPLAPQMGSVMFALAGLGAAAVPWLVGFTSTQLSSLKLGQIMPLAACLVMLLLYLRKWPSHVVVEPSTGATELIH
jgi:fucose permease